MSKKTLKPRTRSSLLQKKIHVNQTKTLLTLNQRQDSILCSCSLFEIVSEEKTSSMAVNHLI